MGHTRAYTVRPTRIPARSHRVNGSTREAREALSRATSLGLPRDLKEKSEDLLTSIEHAERKAANSEAVRRKEVADALKELERLVVGVVVDSTSIDRIEGRDFSTCDIRFIRTLRFQKEIVSVVETTVSLSKVDASTIHVDVDEMTPDIISVSVGGTPQTVQRRTIAGRRGPNGPKEYKEYDFPAASKPKAGELVEALKRTVRLCAPQQQ